MGIKPEAASPSTVYRVLAVRTDGGMGVGLYARQAGGLNCIDAQGLLSDAPICSPVQTERTGVCTVDLYRTRVRYCVS